MSVKSEKGRKVEEEEVMKGWNEAMPETEMGDIRGAVLARLVGLRLFIYIDIVYFCLLST